MRRLATILISAFTSLGLVTFGGSAARAWKPICSRPYWMPSLPLKPLERI